MRKYYALVDGELGVLGVGTSRQAAITDYAEWLMNEADDADWTLQEQIDDINESIRRGTWSLHVEECTRALYDDFNLHGNAASYNTNDAGLLDLWPDDEKEEPPC